MSNTKKFNLFEALEDIGGAISSAFRRDKDATESPSLPNANAKANLDANSETLATDVSDKMVINRCYGSFGLSNEALRHLGVDDHYQFDDNRSDPRLIECIQTLGNKASASYSELVVIDKPAGAFKIFEYDGMETVVEPLPDKSACTPDELQTIVINKRSDSFCLSEEAKDYLQIKSPGDEIYFRTHRDDPRLVECIEKMGDKATDMGELSVIQIPKGDYVIMGNGEAEYVYRSVIYPPREPIRVKEPERTNTDDISTRQYSICSYQKGYPFPDTDVRFTGTLAECKDFIDENHDKLFEDGAVILCYEGNCHAEFMPDGELKLAFDTRLISVEQEEVATSSIPVENEIDISNDER